MSLHWFQEWIYKKIFKKTGKHNHKQLNTRLGKKKVLAKKSAKLVKVNKQNEKIK